MYLNNDVIQACIIKINTTSYKMHLFHKNVHDHRLVVVNWRSQPQTILMHRLSTPWENRNWYRDTCIHIYGIWFCSRCLVNWSWLVQKREERRGRGRFRLSKKQSKKSALPLLTGVEEDIRSAQVASFHSENTGEDVPRARQMLEGSWPQGHGRAWPRAWVEWGLARRNRTRPLRTPSEFSVCPSRQPLLAATHSSSSSKGWNWNPCLRTLWGFLN